MSPDSDTLPHRGLARRVAISLRLVLCAGALLAGLVALTVFLIGRAADERTGALLAEELNHSAVTIAGVLQPVLRAATPGDVGVIAQAMEPYAATDRTLRLFFTPVSGGGVYFIAGAPAQAAAHLEEEAARAVTSGRLGDFSGACVPVGPASPTSADFLWAVAPIASPAGCWRLVLNRTAIAAAVPFFSLPSVRGAALAAAAAALLMLAAAVLALTQIRRLRELGDFTQTFPEITPLPDATLLPQPANDARAAEGPQVARDPDETSAQILDIKRGTVDLSAAVLAYTDMARQKLGPNAAPLHTEVQRGLLIDGRADFIHTILEDLVDPALQAAATQMHVQPISLSLTAEDSTGRGQALLVVATPRIAGGDDTGGRLALIKQFVVALGASVTNEVTDSGDIVRLRFPLSPGHRHSQKDVG